MAEREEDEASGISGRSWFPRPGALVETGDPWEPYYLSDPAGGRVGPVSEFLRDLQAAGRPATTQRSYSLALLRWFRFTWAVGVPWNQATRAEARDFCRWLQLADKPGRPAAARARAGEAAVVGEVRAVDGGALRDGLPELLRLSPGGGDRADREPVPAGQAGAGARAPQPDGPVPEAEGRACSGRGFPQRVPRQIPDAVFNELFARLRLEPGPGPGRVLGLHRRAGLGAPRRRLLGRRPGPAADHRDPQGIAGDPAAPGVAGRVRVAAALPAGGARAGARRAGRPAVVDAAAAVPAAGLPRGPDDVRPGERRGRRRVDAPLPASHGRLPARPRPGHADHRRAVGPRPRLADDHADLRRPDGRGRHRGHAGPPPAAGRAQARSCRSRRQATGPESLDVLFGKGRW